jgi:heterodisulfide reductase subunit A-like polyferredoxin
MYDALIIGGGIAGCTCAQALASKGLHVALVEKDMGLGGKVANMGCKATAKCSNCLKQCCHRVLRGGDIGLHWR